MIWELLSEIQREEVKETIRSAGFEIGDVYAQVKENTKEPMVFDSEMNKIDISEVIEGIYLGDLNN